MDKGGCGKHLPPFIGGGGGEGAWGTPYTSDILDINSVNGASTTTTQALPS
jgi:hypothetical protein